MNRPLNGSTLPPGRGRIQLAARIACAFGALAALAFALFTVILAVQASAVPRESRSFMWIAIIAAAVVTLLLAAATVTRLAAPAVGHVLLIVAAALGIAYTNSFTFYNYFHGPSVYGAGNTGLAVAQLIFGVVLCLAALLGTAIAATARSRHSMEDGSSRSTAETSAR